MWVESTVYNHIGDYHMLNRCMLVFCAILMGVDLSVQAQVQPNKNIKVYGYLVSWALDMTGIPGGSGAANYGNCPYDAIDYDACTDYIMFDAHFTSTGGIETRAEWDGGITWGPNPTMIQMRRPLNNYIHSKGKSVQMTMFVDGTSWDGTAGNWTMLLSTVSGRNQMIKTIVDSIIGSVNQYDGVHFDVEPLGPQDTVNARIFFAQLRDTLNKYHQWVDPSKKPLITAAVYNYPAFWGGVAYYLDGILHMSYNMFGSWNTITWFNAPVYDTGFEGLSYNVGSIKETTEYYISQGIPRDKLVMACPFNYNAYRGGATANNEGCYAPMLQMTTYPTWVNTNEEMYYNCWNKYIDTATTTLHYDNIRKAPWIGYNNPGSSNDMLILFQDTASIRANLEYLSSAGIQGAMVWEITGGYLSVRNVGSGYLTRHPGLARDHLLQAVKKTRLDLKGQSPNTPALSTDKNSVAFGDVLTGSISPVQSYILSGLNLAPPSGNITITAPDGFQVSEASGSGFGTSVSLGYSGGTLGSTEIFVRFMPSQVKDYSGNIVNSGGGVGTQAVAVAGKGVAISGSIRSVPAVLPYGGGTVKLYWTSQNASSASINQGIGNVGLNDSLDVFVPTSTTYTLTLSNNTATVQYTASVQVLSAGTDEIIYSDSALAPGWSNCRSWSSTYNYSNTESCYDGATSILVSLQPWASMQFSIGEWGKFTPIDPTGYAAFNFAIRGVDGNVSLQVSSVNSTNSSQKTPLTITAESGSWSVVSIPFSQLADSAFTAFAFSAKATAINIMLDKVYLSARTTDVIGKENKPKGFKLLQNYPNPFNPSTTIGYQLDRTSHVKLSVFNLIGMEVGTLVNEFQNEGYHSVVFTAGNLSSGIYYVKLQAEGEQDIKKIVLLK
jgi:spore germination protein YaaH